MCTIIPELQHMVLEHAPQLTKLSDLTQIWDINRLGNPDNGHFHKL